MNHEDAIRIARSGEGAIVAELLRLSRERERSEYHIRKLQDDLIRNDEIHHMEVEHLQKQIAVQQLQIDEIVKLQAQMKMMESPKTMVITRITESRRIP